MSKLDQLRRQREAQHERQQQQGGEPGSAPPAKPPLRVEAAPAAAKGSRAGDAETGSCSVCGKVRALNNGLVSNHQKGLGKMCPGSRKAPA
jgi:hypothetical protein